MRLFKFLVMCTQLQKLPLLPILLISALLVYYVIVPFVRVLTTIHPVRSHITSTPVDRGLEYEAITFNSTDGIPLAGWYIPTQNGAVVIIVHGFLSNRTDMLDQAEALAKAGFGVLLYDMRAHGESADAMFTRGWSEVNDLLGAVSYLQSRSDTSHDPIGVFGFSIGGQVAIRTAALTDKIKAVAADGASTSMFGDEVQRTTLSEWLNFPAIWMYYQQLALFTGTQASAVLDVIGAIAPRPLLLISTGSDFEQRQIRQYFKAAGEPKMSWEIPEAGHGGGFAARPDEYGSRIVEFFHKALVDGSGS
jgi:uncharacterized protein